VALGDLDRHVLRVVIRLIKPGLGHPAPRRGVSRRLSCAQVPKEELHDGIRGILAGKKTPLVLWDKNNWGTITVKSYIHTVLIPALQPFWHQQSEQGGQPLWLMEDGASAHWARFITQALEQYGICKFALPPSFPNLNPIENVWYILTDMLVKHSPRPQGWDGMANAIKEEWQKIDKVHLLTFMDFMPERIEAIIAASGGHTPW